MKLVIDANILIASTIRDSSVRKIILQSNHFFFAPKEIVSEVEKYLELISKKNNLTIEENKTILEHILKRVTVIPSAYFSDKFKTADNIIGSVDKGDISYIALALSFPNDGIWTEDKHFEQQNKVKIWKTKDLVQTTSRFA